MKKIWNIVSWVGGFGLLLFLLAFGQSQKEQLVINQYKVEFQESNSHFFVTQTEVEEMVRELYPLIDSISSQEINISVLEESLDNHPSIIKAEVYSALDGLLRIRVEQKKPCIRVRNSLSDYYIAEQGDSMALSSNFSATVPLITGNVSAKNRNQIFLFFQKIEKDAFYGNFISGLHVNNDDTWVLYPTQGRHKILLGSPERIDEKLKNLNAFYNQVVSKQNLDSIASLNLKFEGQVICKKYE